MWNEDHTFIVTEVRLAPTEVLKGQAEKREMTVTIMGGQVGDTTVLVLGAPVLIPGQSYVLFLNDEHLPGVKALTVRDQLQGAFDVIETSEGIRAISQANNHPLLPDKNGVSSPPGGLEGFSLEGLKSSIRAIDHSDRLAH